MPILIKRYANRKLYNTATSRYITLKGIADLLDEGEEVRVIDNETGEDITSVALSQILVDSERSKPRGAQGLLSQILGKGGDALYEALRKGVDDASDNFEEIQERLRRIVGVRDGERTERDADDERAQSGRRRSARDAHEPASERGQARSDPGRRGARSEGGERGRRGLSDWIAFGSPDVEQIVQGAVERMFKVLDLPRRSDIEALNENLTRVAHAIEMLERAIEPEPEPRPAATPGRKPTGGSRTEPASRTPAGSSRARRARNATPGSTEPPAPDPSAPPRRADAPAPPTGAARPAAGARDEDPD